MTTSSIRSTLALAALFLVAAATAASAGVPGMRFSVRPDLAGALSEGGDYFVVEAEVGSSFDDALELSNPTRRPVRVELAAVDAATAQMGGVDYTPSDAPPQRTGTWIDLSTSSVTVAPGEVRIVPFHVSVPQDAPPGVNLAGIAAWTPSRGRSVAESAGLDTALEVHTRRVVAVQVELPGPQEPVLEIDGVTAVARPDGVYLQVDIRNTGHGFAEGEGTVEVGEFSHTFPLDRVVPGTGVGYPVRWRDDAPADGAYGARVMIDYGSGVAEWAGDVVVGDSVRRDLVDRGIGKTGELPLAAVVAGGAAVFAGAAAWLWRRRRKRAASASPTTRFAPAPPAPPPAPPPGAPAAAAPPRNPDGSGAGTGGRRHAPPPPPPPAPLTSAASREPAVAVRGAGLPAS